MLPLGVLGAALAVILALTAGIATTEPAAIERQRAEVAAIQGELDRINGEVGAAAEAYNGAVYEFGQVRQRIADNNRELATTTRDLGRMREVLERRLVQMYTANDPSLAEILVTSGSITEIADRVDLVQRVGSHDASVVHGLRTSRARLAELRAQLVDDRARAAEQVQARAREKERIEGLLAERRAILDSASARLQNLLAAERERQRREAEAEAEAARQRAAALDAQQQANSRPQSSTPSEGSSSGSSEPSSSSEPAASVPSGDGNGRAADIAMQYLGVPYRWGGADPSGFDCSGLASYAYAQIGISVPHYTGAIYSQFSKVPAGSLQRGDMVFFRSDLGHMGIYIGGGQYVHAPQTGDVVKVSSLSGRSDYQGAVRP